MSKTERRARSCAYEHANTLLPSDFDSFDHKCNLSSIASRILKEHLPDFVRRSLDHQDRNGWTALMRASNKGLCEVAGKLLEKGARVDIQQ